MNLLSVGRKRNGMKNQIRAFFVVALSLSLLFVLAGCKNNSEIKISKDAVLSTIENDFYSDEDSLMKICKEKTDISITEINENTIKIALNSPDICTALFEQTRSEGNITNEEIEQSVITLLNETKKTERSFELEYFIENGEITINYDEGFGNAISCGMIEFYKQITQGIISDMEGTQ